jgi:hypothetical protein
MVMTPEAKGQLSKTIRALRSRLLEDFKSANDSTFKYSIRRIDQAKLSEANATRRRRIEDWIAEQVRGEAGKKTKRTAEDFRRDLEKQAAYTLLNRMLILRLMEAMGLHRGDLVAKGWNSAAYKSFRFFSQEIVRGEESEGYSVLLQMVFDDLAIDMPGLYGSIGISDLIPVPTKTLRAVVDAFADPELESCWTDDMTLGWVYQYWNDPEREALDAKINDGGKIEPHEIASKTQMFTERYMVDWLLQNSLGPMWLAMCKKHGWTPLAESSGTLRALEMRRDEWRAKRDAGEVSLTDLMPLQTEMEHRWAYYVPQEMSDDAIEHAPETVRGLKILDPAVGSGHFLVVAFDLLFALYQEEAQHRRQQDDDAWSTKSIVESILENNLHGIDLDPRAVQIAASALWLKAQVTCRESHPRNFNLVASNLQLASLPDNDPALVELRTVVEKETGMPGKLTDTIVQALRGADHLGSLLQIDKAVDEAITQHETALATRPVHYTRDLFGTPIENQQKIDFDAMATRQSLLEGLERFLKSHTSGEDLGLRTRGKQLAAGVRFMRMVKEGSYDLVVANPPYLGTNRCKDEAYIDSHYPDAKSDLYACFLSRGLDLVKVGFPCSLLTMRNWLFLKQCRELRWRVLRANSLLIIADFDRGAFEELAAGPAGVAVAASIIRKGTTTDQSIAIRPSPLRSVTHDYHRKTASTLVQSQRYDFKFSDLEVVLDWPAVYWWTKTELDQYANAEKIANIAPAYQGMATSNNVRYLRMAWEVDISGLIDPVGNVPQSTISKRWVSYVKGGEGRAWIEPVSNVIRWDRNGLDVKVFNDFRHGGYTRTIKNEHLFFKIGIAYTTIGNSLVARKYRAPSVFDMGGASIFPKDTDHLLCLFNSKRTSDQLSDLNPTVNFQTYDVDRLPVLPVNNSDAISNAIEDSFAIHESHRECSVEFKLPGGSPWRHAQEWARIAVDLPEGSVLNPFVNDSDPEHPSTHLSFAIGVALGRFHANGNGITNPKEDLDATALPNSIMFLDGTLDESDMRDSLGHSAVSMLHTSWQLHRDAIACKSDLRQWLRLDFFSSVHKDMYDNRPIHWALSSRNKTFVALINVHRWNANTLRSLLANHLQSDALPRIDGELEDLRKSRTDGIKISDARFLQVQKWKEELDEFIALVKECAEKGPPPTDDKCPKREVDARYCPILDDGVMINSAALWPLLEPQWKDPKKWWKELALASSKGSKDYDWSHLAMRYFPTRVDEKCQKDPSLGVAHGCFWKYHPAKAWAWELRLQHEIAPDFRIEEASYRGDGGDVEHRAAYLRDHALEAIASIEKEVHRRRKDAPGKLIKELTILEPGLWSSEPEACWDMETRIIKKQEFGFRLIAPDEAEARAKLIAETPQKETGRRRMLEGKGGSATYLVGWEEVVQES